MDTFVLAEPEHQDAECGGDGPGRRRAQGHHLQGAIIAISGGVGISRAEQGQGSEINLDCTVVVLFHIKYLLSGVALRREGQGGPAGAASGR